MAVKWEPEPGARSRPGCCPGSWRTGHMPFAVHERRIECSCGRVTALAIRAAEAPHAHTCQVCDELWNARKRRT